MEAKLDRFISYPYNAQSFIDEADEIIKELERRIKENESQ